jgi:hypothetical protein
MAYYRLEFLDSRNRILRAQSIECENDAAAECIATEKAGSLAVELWDYDRCVKRFKAGASADRLTSLAARQPKLVL